LILKNGLVLSLTHSYYIFAVSSSFVIFAKMRGLHGVFPVLKPAGVTSSQLLEMIKANLGMQFFIFKNANFQLLM